MLLSLLLKMIRKIVTRNNELEIRIFENTGALIFKIALYSDETITQVIKELISKAVYGIHDEYDDEESVLKNIVSEKFSKILLLNGEIELRWSFGVMRETPSDIIKSVEYFAKLNELEIDVFLGLCLHPVVRGRFEEFILEDEEDSDKK